ncbi:MAG: hypothetical protein QS2022_2530 [Candidatus Phytoplasma asteris]|uniref:Methyl-accepting chemotaxis protein n=1 Tax='Chrysanthemum coronarium' phytoplasma TaxID=1520703 RepID=A0ABQ0J2B4_9MOLU|nr:hypothetical protein ['Chrysanthemum coronarium' phytoplasma]TKA88024.1 MAG: hypothetical protein PLY_2520 [Periwinkle leaf yellowing phytoplasma]WEX19519.1 MAG: hypothetical protein QS2022_2530 [Candidatus Phytoplasma asteris]GAK73749.1 methyl-accepting chemotaxis protein ['Chrysanthemum coronarium' phytoplasma]
MKFLVKDICKNPISDDALNYLTQNVNDVIENDIMKCSNRTIETLVNDDCINMCRNKHTQIEVQDLKEACLSALGFIPQ